MSSELVTGTVSTGDTFAYQQHDLNCPICHRDYEMPRRYRVHRDDFDYKPIPRLLACLHTVCHSCLEDQRQRNGKGVIICPICKNQEITKGVGYMPLDVSVLKQIVSTIHSSFSMSVCSRCYEDVPSVSLCLTCSAALCEFHHQDHKLSVDTAAGKHVVHTFKEISHRGLSIDYNFPPIACPEVVMQDCSLYCQDCLHLVSAQGMIEYHRDHQVEDIRDVVPPLMTAIEDSSRQNKGNCKSLAAKLAEIQGLLKQLDKNEDLTNSEITRVFDMMHKKLEQRKRKLLDRTAQIAQEKRFELTEQLSTLSELQEDCQHAARVADELLEVTIGKSDVRDQIRLTGRVAPSSRGSEHDSDTGTGTGSSSRVEHKNQREDEGTVNNEDDDDGDEVSALSSTPSSAPLPPTAAAVAAVSVEKAQRGAKRNLACTSLLSGKKEVEAMYLVAAAEAVEFRSDTLHEMVEARLVDCAAATVNPEVSVQFVSEEASEFLAHLRVFGAIHFVHDQEVRRQQQQQQQQQAAVALAAAVSGAAGAATAGASLTLSDVVDDDTATPSTHVEGGDDENATLVPIHKDKISLRPAGHTSTTTTASATKTNTSVGFDPKANLPKIRFSVKIRNDPSERFLSSHSDSSSQIQHSQSSVGGGGSMMLPKSNEFIVIEARLVNPPPPPPPPPSLDGSKHRASGNDENKTNYNYNNDDGRTGKNESSSSEGGLVGALLGSVIVNTDIDRRLLTRHQLHSYFESLREGGNDGLPILKVVKEFIPV